MNANGTRVGYARVSTIEQNLTAQVERLTAAGCTRVFTDQGVSGKLASRPEWDKCLAFLRPGDILVATKLDRFGRSVRNLHNVVEKLHGEGIDVQCLDQPIDTTTAAGKLFFTLLAAFAEFERDLISQRTREALAATPNRGRNGGRKPSLAGYQVSHARAQVDAGVSVADIARELGVHRATVYRSLS